MRCSFGTEVAFATNRRCSKIPSILGRADSALAACITVASFDPRSSRFERQARPTSELQTRRGLSYAIMTIRCRWLLITSTNSTSTEIGQNVLSGLGQESGDRKLHETDSRTLTYCR